MQTPRISASSYSNTAPLIWSFLYGSRHGSVELILDNAPARSAELLAQDRVDAALVPVIAFQQLDDVKLVRDVCVGARRQVRSVGLITRGQDLVDVRSVALDVSSKTSVILTKIIFREFLGFEPEWREAEPDINMMLEGSDAALLIGDPALRISELGFRNDSNAECGEPNAEFDSSSGRESDKSHEASDTNSAIRTPHSAFKKFDLAELWHAHTGLGFVFAMWMSKRDSVAIDFAAVRDEGLAHVANIAANYENEIGLSANRLIRYLSENISYDIDESMQAGLELYFRLAEKCGLIEAARPLRYLE